MANVQTDPPQGLSCSNATTTSTIIMDPSIKGNSVPHGSGTQLASAEQQAGIVTALQSNTITCKHQEGTDAEFCEDSPPESSEVAATGVIPSLGYFLFTLLRLVPTPAQVLAAVMHLLSPSSSSAYLTGLSHISAECNATRVGSDDLLTPDRQPQAGDKPTQLECFLASLDWRGRAPRDARTVAKTLNSGSTSQSNGAYTNQGAHTSRGAYTSQGTFTSPGSSNSNTRASEAAKRNTSQSKKNKKEKSDCIIM